jgi:hypothetical protein
MRRFLSAALAVLTLAAVGGVAAAGAQAEPAVVDFGACAFENDGQATVPAGVPISLQDTGSFAEGTFGLSSVFRLHASATATITVTGGTTTVLPLTLSQPQFIGDDINAWLVFLPDIALEPLASGGSVLVTIDTSFSQPAEVVFPMQKHGAPHFGPFHVTEGFSASCLITAT